MIIRTQKHLLNDTMIVCNTRVWVEWLVRVRYRITSSLLLLLLSRALKLHLQRVVIDLGKEVNLHLRPIILSMIDNCNKNQIKFYWGILRARYILFGRWVLFKIGSSNHTLAEGDSLFLLGDGDEEGLQFEMDGHSYPLWMEECWDCLEMDAIY